MITEHVQVPSNDGVKVAYLIFWIFLGSFRGRDSV